jgi:hypothetical protein
MSKPPKVHHQELTKPKATRNIFQSIKSHLQKRLKPKSAIFNIDDKTIYQICRYLDLVDQACLSLSCKKYLNLLASIRTHKDLYKRPYYSNRHVIRPSNRSSLSDTQLAKLCVRLQNEDWVFCRTCRRLHTRDAWDRQEYVRRVREREQKRERMRRENRASGYVPDQSAMLMMSMAMMESDYYQ